jgi:hypothetical protein
VGRELRFDVTALDQASKVFVRMAQAVDRFERRLDKLDGKRVDATVDVDTKRADDKIGRFATDMRRKVQAAVDSLPDIELDANSTDLDRKLVDVRRRMQELSDKRIGIDLSAEEAIAEARLLQSELERLGRESPDIQVQADTAAAIAQLAAVDVAVDRVDGRTATVKIDVDRSLSETLIQVAQLGRALGALALPGAIVAATPQLAALGAAALTAAGSVGLIPGAAAAAAGGIGTLMLGFRGFGDAVSEDDPAKAAEAIGKLAPAAQDAARAVRGLGPAWSAMQLTTQNRLFSQLGREISAVGTRYIPIIGDATERMAEHFNRAGFSLSAFLQNSKTVSIVQSLFSDVENTVENLAKAFTPLTSAVIDLAAGGTQVLEELSRGAGDAAESFATMVRSARESGELQAWIRDGVTAMGQLFSITGNVGSLLASVFRAGETASGSFLGNVDRITEAMSEWASSAQGQETLTALFRGINDTVAELLPGLRDLGLAVVTVVGMLGQSGVFTGFAGSLSAVASAAAPLLVILGALASVVLPPLLELAQLLAPVLVPLAAGLLAIRAASAGLDRLRSFGTAVGEARSNVAGALSPMRQLSGEMRVQASLARSAEVSHAGLRGAVAAMANSQSAAAQSVASGARAMATSYSNTATAVQGAASRLGAAAEQASTSLGERMAARVSRGVEAIIRIPGAVADAARSTAMAARDMGQSLSTGLQRGVIYAQETFRQLPQIADNAMERLRTAVYAGAVNASDALRTAAYDMRRSVAIVADSAADMGRRLSDGAATAVAGLRALPGQVADVGRSVGTGLRTGVSNAVTALRELPAAAADAGRSLRTGLETGVIYARETLRQLPADAANAGRSLATGLRTGVSAAGDAMRTFGTTVASGARTAAEGVATGLRSIPGHVQTAFAGLGAGVNTGIGHLGRLGGAAAGAGAAIGTGIVRGGTSLIDFLGGPWGIALGAAGVALSLFAEKQQESAQRVAENKQAIDGLKGTLDQVTGAATNATRAMQAQELSQTKLSDGTTTLGSALRQAGIDAGDFVDATSGNQPKLEAINGTLARQASALIQNSDLWQNNKWRFDEAGVSLETVTAASLGNVEAQEEMRSRLGATAGGQEEWNRRLRETVGPLGEIGSKLGAMSGQYAEAARQTQEAAAASKDFTTILEAAKVGFDSLASGAPQTELMAASLRNLGTSAVSAAQGAGEAAAKFGGVDAGAKAAAAAMQQSRDAFIAATPAAMQASGEAARLADQIGLIPAAAETNFRTNATGVAAEMNVLKAQIDRVPAGKEVRVQALTDEARGRLESLGFQVEQLKDGTFVIRGNTDDARAKLQDLDAAAKTPATKPMLGDPSDVLSKDAEARDAIRAPATKPMLADPSDVRGKDAEARGLIQQSATKPMLGDPSDALSKDAGVRDAVTTGSTKPMAGDNAVGMGAARELQDSAQAPATKPVDAETGSAWTKVQGLISLASKTVTMMVNVVANKLGFADGGIMPMAAGGVVAPGAGARIVPLANGDAGDPDTFNGHRLTPMSANTAQVVRPRTYRVIGDNPRYNELYMPMNPDSARSQALLEIGAASMGRQLVPRGMKLQPGPGVAVAPMAEGGMVTAARAILARMSARQPMFEDWTWRGAPAVVGQYNDALLDSMKRAGYRYADGRAFLEDYIRRSTAAARPVAVPSPAAVKAQVQAAQAAKAAAPSVTVQTGLDVAELRAIRAQLIGLRADVIASGQFGPQLVEQMRALTSRALSQLPATMRSAAMRDLAEIGGWNV